MDSTIYEIEEGGLNTFTHKRIGHNRSPNLILNKGINCDNELIKWYHIKKIIISNILLLSSIYLYSSDFSDLHNDLVNYWQLGRRPVYLGIDYYLEKFGMAIFTGNDYDFIVSGNGFFVVYDEINNKKYLTRNGRFLFNSMGILVNDDGYFVLDINEEHIYYKNFNINKNYFQDVFLLAMPVIETINNITDKYIDVSDIILLEWNRVNNKLLEAMPVSLDILLDTALLDVDNNREYNNMQELIKLLYKRYYEIREIDVGTEDYYNSLYIKIMQLENNILNKEK